MIFDYKRVKATLNEVYQPYFNKYDFYYEVYYGGAGSGKSQFIARKLILKLLKSKRRLLVVRKIYGTMADSVYALLVDVITKWKLKPICNITKSPLHITLPNGSEIIFKGMDDEEKLKSLDNISDVWIEEASELLKNDFDQLGLRMRGSGDKQQIFISFNPISSEHWLHDMFFKRVQENAFILKTTYKHNRFLPGSYIKKIEELKETNPRYYQIYGLGDWGTAEGLILTNYVIESNLYERVKNFSWKRNGIDWGFNDPAAAMQIAIHDNELYIYGEYYRTGRIKEEMAEDVEYLKNDKIKIVADSSEPASIELFRRNRFYIVAAIKPKGSIIDGVNTMKNFKKIHIDSKCINIIKELQNYTYKFDKKSGKYLEDPIDDWCHGIDACRYALEDWTYSKRVGFKGKIIEV